LVSHNKFFNREWSFYLGIKFPTQHTLCMITHKFHSCSETKFTYTRVRNYKPWFRTGYEHGKLTSSISFLLRIIIGTFAIHKSLLHTLTYVCQTSFDLGFGPVYILLCLPTLVQQVFNDVIHVFVQFPPGWLEFSPIGLLFTHICTRGSCFWKLDKWSKLFGLFFDCDSYVYILTICSTIFGRFFHKVIWSPWFLLRVYKCGHD
jgi:hypothetical protein